MDERMQNLLKLLERKYSNGAALYEILEQNRPDNMDILICPMHIGDTLWIALYADAYKQQHHCDQLLFVVPEAQITLPGLFPAIDDVFSLSKDQLDDLRLYIAMNEYWYHAHIRYAHFHFDTIVTTTGIYLRDYFPTAEKCDFMSRSRCLLLDLPLDSPKSPATPPCVDTALSEKYHNAVMLMPAALSQPTALPDTFWQKLVIAIKNAGYAVYCNYNGLPGENLLSGTLPLASSLMEMYQFSQTFHRFIGFRSGICDLLALAHAPLTVIHPKLDEIPTINIPANAPLVDHLYQLNQLESLQSLQYRAEWEDELIAEILATLT